MDALNLESAGVEVGEKGHITVDEWQVNVPTLPTVVITDCGYYRLTTPRLIVLVAVLVQSFVLLYDAVFLSTYVPFAFCIYTHEEQ